MRNAKVATSAHLRVPCKPNYLYVCSIKGCFFLWLCAIIYCTSKMDIGNIDEKVSLIMKKLESLALPIGTREFSREDYETLFPNGTIKTPIGIVKLGFHQFEKMEAKKRRGLVAAMFFTLKEPVVILPEERENKKSRIYIKSIRELGSLKITYIISVVVDIDGQAVAISTGKRKRKQIIQKIKLARSFLYER